MVGHFDWVENRMVKPDLSIAMKEIQQVLKPGQSPEGSKEDNQGKLMLQLLSMLQRVLMSWVLILCENLSI